MMSDFRNEEISYANNEKAKNGYFLLLKTFADISLFLTGVSVLFCFYYTVFIFISLFAALVTVVLYFSAFCVCVSYDYSLCDGVVTVNKVVANRFRRKKMVFNLRSEVSAIGLYDGNNFVKAAENKKLKFFSANKQARPDKKLLYFSFGKGDDRIVVLEIGSRFFNLIDKYVGKSIYDDYISF